MFVDILLGTELWKLAWHSLLFSVNFVNMQQFAYLSMLTCSLSVRPATLNRFPVFTEEEGLCACVSI